MTAPDNQGFWLHPGVLGFFAGAITAFVLIYEVYAHHAFAGGSTPIAPLLPAWPWWISGILCVAQIGIINLPDRILSHIPKIVMSPLNFNLGAWISGSLVFTVWTLGVGMTVALDRLPGRYLNLIAISVLPIGYGAHRFKRFNPTYYGITEILFGLITAAGTTFGIKVGTPAHEKTFGTAEGLAIVAAMYVVARGFNNIYDANKDPNALRSGARL